MKDLIVYHDNCHDGITALWCALQRIRGAETYAGRYDAAPDLDRFRGCDVVFVDFCWKPPAMKEVRAAARSVLVLDHHKIAMSEMVGAGENFIDTRTWSEPITWDRHMRNAVQDDMENAHNTIYLLFDMDRSGAGIAWDVLCGGQRPRLIDYVEDRDLWRFNLPGSREVHAACGSYPLTLEDRARLMEREVSDLMEEGFAILRYHDKMVEGAVKHAGRLNIGGHDVPAIACPVIEIASDLGNKLAEGNPFAAVYVDRPDGSRYFQLRSTPAGLDVGEIAQSLGGGGHRNAAGFTLKAEQLSR